MSRRSHIGIVGVLSFFSSMALAQTTQLTVYGGQGQFDINALVVDDTANLSLTLIGEDAAAQNTLGWYRIGDDGEILDAEIVWADASLDHVRKGTLPAADLGELPTGTKVGFFLIAEGYSLYPRLMERIHRGALEFRTIDGEQATIYDRTPELVAIAPNGRERVIEAEIFHQVVREGAPVEIRNLNSDTHVHARSGLMNDGETVMVGFEDLRNGGDQDFDDIVFSIDFH